jgi:hypothetical protein
MTSWEQELREHFPGYLLPAASVSSVSREAAANFLAGLSGESDALDLLLTESALASVATDVNLFAKHLPLAARVLASTTTVDRLEGEGQVRGRLDVSATLRRRLSAGACRVTSRVRRRSFDLDENVFLVGVADMLVVLLNRLRKRGAIAQKGTRGWGQGFHGSEAMIRHALATTPLREVPRTRIESRHLDAAHRARHCVFRMALRIDKALRDTNELDPTSLADLIAKGALAPLERSRRFEIAVLIRLGRSLEKRLSAVGFSAKRGLVERKRTHVFEFTKEPVRVHVYYDSTFDEPGPRDVGVTHYFRRRGRLRPDMRIEVLENGKRVRAVVLEAKLSEDKNYLTQGYEEALLYRMEYDSHLTGWPKAILVTSSDAVRGEPRPTDDVVAISWKRWVPEIVLDGLLAGCPLANST